MVLLFKSNKKNSLREARSDTRSVKLCYCYRLVELCFCKSNGENVPEVSVFRNLFGKMRLMSGKTVSARAVWE